MKHVVAAVAAWVITGAACANPGEHWALMPAGSTDYTAAFVELTSLRHERGVVSFWEIDIVSDESTARTFNGKPVRALRTKKRIDCTRRTFQLLSTDIFDARLQILSSGTEPSEVAELPPGSTVAAVAGIVCQPAFGPRATPGAQPVRGDDDLDGASKQWFEYTRKERQQKQQQRQN